ncbi:Crp/Fnr family transcriptional regulator [Pedobacter antarcticus 4BY]|uniref:Crp/Fnr family transcriptional regulator n=1 Tax=Pedobacter antarcticus 4BY TaxID=1358423 RepID=A0A081PGT3_9SPHI|nr:Crp/Fnr family transcriptional regulator [Pedobacter antarcticus 4BY]
MKQYLLASFPQFEARLIETLIDNAFLKEFNEGDLLMNTGQNMRFTMLVVEGLVKLYREGEDGSEFFMYYIHPGGACALSMICSTKQQTSEIKASAVDKTTVLAVPTTLMDELMKNYKTWYYFVLETYRSRFEELLVVIDHISFKAMDERLEFYLEKQHHDLNTRALMLTHSQIANDLNSSREVISRLLKKMEQQKKVILHRSYIEYLK